ncbi:MAG: tetratricopeptide repeat protein [Prevotella sp.]|jgi:tetratricopeptide (TPR) repeat protein|nr:tetratricopeptide repeat protein [Prevotella sp.]
MAKKMNQKSAQTNVEETLSKSEAFFLKYKNAIIGAVVALVVVVAGAIIYHQYVAVPAVEKASTKLAKGQNLFANQMYEQALNGDSTGFVGLAKLAQELSGDAGNLANLYAGLCCANLDKWEDAAKYLEKYDGQGDQMVSPAAMGALGNVYAQLNQLDKAVATLKKAAELADNNSLSPTFLIQAGEILESQGKKDEALKCYQTIKDKYFNSYGFSRIDEYIERVAE